MIAYPMCDCPASTDPKALVRKVLPDGWQNMSAAAVEEAATIICGECGKVLKPPYTLYRAGTIVTCRF